MEAIETYTGKRTDIHRPSAIDPSQYQFVAMEYIKIGESGDIMGDCQHLQDCRRTIREHMERTGGHYATHLHGGNCMVCGAGAIYTALFYHPGSNEYVRTGQECADKMGFGNADWNAFRTAIRDAHDLRAGKRKAQAILADAGLSAAWRYSAEPVVYQDAVLTWGKVKVGEFAESWGLVLRETGDVPTPEQIDAFYAGQREFDRTHQEEATIRDIVNKLVKFGSISDKALDYVRSLLARIDNRAAIEAQRAAERDLAADVPVGRIDIEGLVLSVKVQSSDFGDVTRIVVKSDAGWKVWGTRPTIKDAECAQVGDRITFRATVTRSDKDSKFGFYSRPTNGRMVARKADQPA